jgi:hypothetical protein
MELLTEDKVILILIAKYVYGDDKVVVRKDGHISFRILNIDPSISKIRKFSYYLSTGRRSGLDYVSVKSIFLGKSVVKNSDPGWRDMPTMSGDEDEIPLYRKTEYMVTIRCDIHVTATCEKPKFIYEFKSTTMVYYENYIEEITYGNLVNIKKDTYLMEDTDRTVEFSQVSSKFPSRF